MSLNCILDNRTVETERVSVAESMIDLIRILPELNRNIIRCPGYALCGKEGVQRVIMDSIVVFPGACLGLGGENARLVRGRGKNLPGMGLAQKRGYDSDKDQEPQPRFFSSRIHHLSGLELAAKRRRCKARVRHASPRLLATGVYGVSGGGSGFGSVDGFGSADGSGFGAGFFALRSVVFARLELG
jgi:hypothetical protein